MGSQYQPSAALMLIADGHASTKHKDDLTYHMTAHLRMNAVYWGLTALCIMKRKEALDAEEMIEYVMSCWDDNAGTSPMSLPSPLPTLPAKESLTLHSPTSPPTQRCFRRTPRTRRAHPLHAKRHPNPSDARRPLAHRLAPHSRLYVPLPPPVPSLLYHPPHQSFWACNNPRASSQATPLARRTRASSTAPSRRSPSSARSTDSIARGRRPTSPRAATLTAALVASPAPRVTRHKVGDPPLSLASFLHLFFFFLTVWPFLSFL